VKIAVLGSRGIPNRYGGFEEMAERVAPSWVKAGHEVVVYATSNHPEKVEWHEGVRVRHIFNPEKILGLAGQFIYDYLCIVDARKQNFDIYLQLGYTTSAIWSFLWPRRKTVINMDGIEHRRAKYRGVLSIFLRWSERKAATRSKLLVADNPMIAEYLNKYSTPCTTIAYGAEVVEHSNASALKKMELPLTNYALHIGRIQPDNHIKEILEAAKTSGKLLITIGDYTNRYGRTLKKEYKDCSTIYFPGTIYDKKIVNQLRLNCDVYLHGHSAGGTNPALLEAMGCGAFVLAHNNPFNASTLGGLGALWSNHNELSEILKNLPGQEIKSTQRELSRNRIREYFDWESIANQYLDAFHEIK
tara:strand:- start:6590 stop:7666 length:1077 start_codon:yes stop_codon:yes gene_type:complete